MLLFNDINVSDKALEFLFLQLIVYMIFFILNLLLMIYDKEGWRGLCENDNSLIIDSFYYTTATHTSIGYGDITPKRKEIRLSSSIHMLLVFFLIILEL